MELAEPSGTNSDSAGGDSFTDESSVASSIEHLVAGSQGVITKRIDLALLEGRELLSRSIERAALVGAGMVLATAAWFAGAGAFVLLVAPDASPVIRLAAFGLLNGAGAVGLVTLAMRHSRPPTRVRPNGNGPTRQREPLPAEGKN
ncbi:MAG: phage holin family protein [Deltaproteobacteria bacterium]|nr:phage holin family protein [Deltaproteobacteria bacterium]